MQTLTIDATLYANVDLEGIYDSLAARDPDGEVYLDTFLDKSYDAILDSLGMSGTGLEFTMPYAIEDYYQERQFDDE